MQLQQKRIQESNFYFLEYCISISLSRVDTVVIFETIWKKEIKVISEGGQYHDLSINFSKGQE